MKNCWTYFNFIQFAICIVMGFLFCWFPVNMSTLCSVFENSMNRTKLSFNSNELTSRVLKNNIKNCWKYIFKQLLGQSPTTFHLFTTCILYLLQSCLLSKSRNFVIWLPRWRMVSVLTIGQNKDFLVNCYLIWL